MVTAGLALVFTITLALQPDVQSALREAASLEQAGNGVAALEIYTRVLDESKPGTRERGEVLAKLASLKNNRGRYQEARADALEASRVFERLGDLGAMSNALNSHGLAFLYEGKYREAEPNFLRAVDLSRRAADPMRLAEQLGNLANVQFFLGRYADAVRLNHEALDVTRRAGNADWAARRRTLLLVNQAILDQRLGRDQQALAVYQELGTSSELRPNEQGQMLVNLGFLHRRLGDPIKALQTYDAARALFERERNVDGELAAMRNRGIVLALDLERLDEAERSFSELLAAATETGNRRHMLHAHLYRAETLFRQGKGDAARNDYQAGLGLAKELQTPEEEWKALFGLGRTAADPQQGIDYLTRAVTTIERVHESIRVPSLRSDFLNDKREVYDALIATRIDQAPVSEIFDLLERSRSRGWREQLGLSGSVDLQSVQRVLPAGVLLLEYWNAPAGSAVVAVTRDRAEVSRKDLDPAAVDRLIESLSAGPDRTGARAPLANLLPDAAWFSGIDHVIVIPDGAVALVPFDLLTIRDKLLIETAAVSYTPTAVTLLRQAPRVSGWRPPWRLQLRAFAEPTFASANLDAAPPLRATDDEVRGIAGELSGRSLLHVGPDNLKSHLFGSHEQAPILHLASHATADGNTVERSRILFSSAGGAGADAEYLFLKEAYELPLDGVELAVLSACDTARGKLVRGEGVQSFSRAFLAAGARSTVTTLWRVADGPTAQFMKVFYHYLQQGATRAESLRRAKLSFMNSGSTLADPHYWAAFVLTGDAVYPVSRAMSWRVTALAAASACAAIVGAVLVSRRAMKRDKG